MAAHRPPTSPPGAGFSFAVRELKEAQRAQHARTQSAAAAHPAADKACGFDPYNSSGSFDRRKNWERVRKR
jgi:hypothetical protein